MKILLAIFLIISTFSAKAQIPKPTYQHIDSLPGFDNGQLFKNAQTWIAKTFGDYKTVVQFEDKASGRIILKGRQNLDGFRIHHNFKYQIAIDIKENKCRITISDIEVGMGVGHPTNYSSIASYGQLSAKYTKEVDSISKLNGGELNSKQRTALEKSKNDTEIIVRLINQIDIKINSLIADFSEAMKIKDDF